MILGSIIGGSLGSAVGKHFGGDAGEKIGNVLGTVAGEALPWFKKGGAVKHTGIAKVHKGEYVLPKGEDPTKAQRAKVAKLHRK